MEGNQTQMIFITPILTFLKKTKETILMTIANTFVDVASVLDKDLGEVTALVAKSKADDVTIADLTAKLTAAVAATADLQKQLDDATASLEALKAKADAIDTAMQPAPVAAPAVEVPAAPAA